MGENAYSKDGTNAAESFHHNHFAGPHLIRFGQEAAWRSDHRRTPNGDRVQRVAKRALGRKKSVDFRGYWQRHKASA